MAVVKDKHNRPLYDTIHVCTSNPIWLYSMKATGDEIQRLPINHLFDTKKQNTIPRIKLAVMGGRFKDAVAVHDEVSNRLLLVDTDSGTCLKVELQNDMLESIKELTKKFTGRKGKAPGQFSRYILMYNVVSPLWI